MTEETETETEIEVKPPEEKEIEKTPEAAELKKAVEEVEAKKPLDLPPKEDWEKRKLKERLAKVTAQLHAARVPTTQTSPDTEDARQREIEAKAEIRARDISAKKAYDDEGFRVVEAGKKEFADFLPKVETLKTTIIEPNDPESGAKYHSLIRAIFETADGDKAIAARLIHTLGSDPEHAYDVVQMSAVRMGQALAKLVEIPEPQPLSKVAKPPIPVGGRAGAHTPIDPSDPARAGKLDINEWMPRRIAQVKARGGR